MSPGAFLRADAVERRVLVRALPRAAKYRLDLDRRLARLIVSEWASVVKRARPSRGH